MLFNEYPFKGENEVILFNQIQSKKDLKSSNDLFLNFLISNMLVVDVNERISWDEYFDLFDDYEIYNPIKFPLFNYFCYSHFQNNNYFCYDCKFNFCDSCINKHSSHQISCFSNECFSQNQKNKINDLFKKIEENNYDIPILNEEMKLLFNKINENQENMNFSNGNIKKDFSKYFLECLKILYEKSKVVKTKKMNDIEKMFLKKKTKLNKNKNLKEEKILLNNTYIKSISIFPLGNIILSFDKSINIYDINYNVIQKLENIHNSIITDISLKDENNFATCSQDKNIKTWIKKDNKFIRNKIIEKAHKDWITNIIYYLDNRIISSSYDKKIKIWIEDEFCYKNEKIINNENYIFSLLLFQEKNILISSNDDEIKFWNIKNYNCISEIKGSGSISKNSLKKIDNDRFIVGNKTIKIISISEKKIIKEIITDYYKKYNYMHGILFGICVIQEKGIFLVTENIKDIKVYDFNNYKCIQTINNAHNKQIYGLIELIDGSIISYSEDMKVKIWSF